MNELALFSGTGGGILGGMLAGFRTVCAVEINPYAASVLCQRQNDGILPPFPIWDDVRTFDGTPWRGIIDVVSGGFPCQDISSAGTKKGINGDRSGLWKEMARVISEVRPRFVFIENSPMLRTRGLATVLKNLAEMGYNAEWGVLCANQVGAPHKRARIWIVANSSGFASNAWRTEPKGQQWKTRLTDGCKKLADANLLRELQQKRCKQDEWKWFSDCSWWEAEPCVGRVANGVAYRVDRLEAIGNGQVPMVACKAWQILSLGVK